MNILKRDSCAWQRLKYRVCGNPVSKGYNRFYYYTRRFNMKLLEYITLFANIVSVITFIPYALGVMFMFAITEMFTNELLLLLISSIYPLVIFACIYYSRKLRLNNKIILACCIACIPVLIALGIILIRLVNLGHF